MIHIFTMLSTILFLSACSTPTKVVKPLSEKDQGIRNIQSVRVAYSDLSKDKLISLDEKTKAKEIEKGKSEEEKYKSLRETLEEIAKERLESRDSDENQYADVEIEVDNLKLVNPVAAMLVGDTDQLAGTVRVYDPKTKELLTEFYVDVLNGTGGLVGLAVRGGGVREKLSLQFSDYIGDELGFRKVKTPPKSNNREE